jgi:hypothetical protein
MANPNGGPSKLLRLKDRSLAAARQGHTLEAACGGLGVHRSANLHWLAASRTASSGQYRDFLAYEDAQNTAERVLTSKLLAAANKEPRVLMWILERRFPGNWRLQQHQHSPAQLVSCSSCGSLRSAKLEIRTAAIRLAETIATDSEDQWS